MFSATFDTYTVLYESDGLPLIYDEYKKHATRVEEFDMHSEEGAFCFVAVQIDEEWPRLTIAQCYAPAGYGFNPGILLVPETELLFIGAGERLLAYELTQPKRLWEDHTEMGFWGWSRHQDVVLMAAELELAAWNLRADKLWSTFVEPPWSFRVDKEAVLLDVMGKESSFGLRSGPSKEGTAR